MSKFLNTFAPILGGTVVLLGGAYYLADHFISEPPPPAQSQAASVTKPEAASAVGATEEAQADATEAAPAEDAPAEAQAEAPETAPAEDAPAEAQADAPETAPAEDAPAEAQADAPEATPAEEAPTGAQDEASEATPAEDASAETQADAAAATATEEAPAKAQAEAAPASAPADDAQAAKATDASGDTAKYGIGRPATADEIAAWDVNVMPDTTGLPEGSGSVEDGEVLFSDNCAVCHGEFAEGSGNWPKLAGGEGTLANQDPVKTVGSYWPYLSTTFDYIHRSMPFGAAQTLSVDDTYAITAYILYSNFLVDEDFVLSNENFLDVKMPNADGFIVDDRPETEYPQWRGEPCMTDCKQDVEITMRASVLDVTPDEPGDEAATDTAADTAPAADTAEEQATQANDAAPAADEAATADAAAAPAEEEAPAKEATEEAANEEAATEEAAPVAPAADPELIAKGEKVFKKCKACHQIGEGAKNKTGPELNGIMGRHAGSVEGFKYSKAMTEAGAGGLVWNIETLTGFLTKPRDYIKGTKMSFAGLRKQSDIEAVEAYLSSFPE